MLRPSVCLSVRLAIDLCLSNLSPSATPLVSLQSALGDGCSSPQATRSQSQRALLLLLSLLSSLLMSLWWWLVQCLISEPTTTTTTIDAKASEQSFKLDGSDRRQGGATRLIGKKRVSQDDDGGSHQQVFVRATVFRQDVGVAVVVVIGAAIVVVVVAVSGDIFGQLKSTRSQLVGRPGGRASEPTTASTHLLRPASGWRRRRAIMRTLVSHSRWQAVAGCDELAGQGGSWSQGGAMALELAGCSPLWIAGDLSARIRHQAG